LTAAGNAQLADAAMALLGARSADEVYEIIGDFMLLLAPGAVVVVNEASPDLEWLTTRAIKGLDASLLAKAAALVGFEIVGRRSAMLPARRRELLSGTLSMIPGGFVELASVAIPRPLARAGARVFNLHDAYSIGIADGESALGNIQIYTRTSDSVLPTHIIESFAHHCFSALATIRGMQEITRLAERDGLLLSSMVEGLALHEIILDEKGQPCDYRFLDANPAFETMTGLKAEDLIGHTVLEVLPTLAPIWIQRYGAVATTGVSARFEDDVPELGRHYEIVAYSPQPGQFAALISDITERREVQDALRESRDQFRTMFDASPLGIALIDSDTGRMCEVNPRLAEIAGRTQDEMRASDWMAITHPDDLQRDLDQMARLNVGETSRLQMETRYLRPDGSVVWTSMTIAPLRDPDVSRRRHLAMIEDITERRRIEQELAEEQQRGIEHLAKSLVSIVEVVSQVAETRDPYTAGHQRRVSELAACISEDMGMSAKEIEETRIAALLHDIGKMSVPAEILSKPGTLSALEFELIKVHAEAGYRIIASAKMEGLVADIVYQHHERCDGSGYPRGLRADELLPAAKVLMVADVVEAMTSHRPYRPGLGIEAALAEIEQGAGGRYDGQVAASCLRAFREHAFAFSEE
jgi:PAS domain S-box-containing protein/putative nucleotidyltransferase with HDIG domain